MSLTMDMEYDPVNRMMGRFIIRIRVPQEFPEKYDSGVINAAAVCAVKKHLKESIVFDVAVERV
jgi:ribosomal protein S12 methylthiotransferase accessory factor